MSNHDQNQFFRQVQDECRYMLQHGREVVAKIMNANQGMIHHAFAKSQDAQDFLRWLKTDSPLDKKEKQQLELKGIRVMPSRSIQAMRDLPEMFCVSISQDYYQKLNNKACNQDREQACNQARNQDHQSRKNDRRK
jgi:hypothetical protein